MKKQLGAAILAFSLGLGVVASATAQTTSQDSEVNVTVSGVTQLDVRPTELTYDSGLSPGVQASGSDEANGYTEVEVENIGSNNISKIYAETSYAESDPFGTGTTSSYDSGNFVQISTDTVKNGSYSTADWIGQVAGGDARNFHYVNRVEYEDEPVPTYIETLGESETGSFLDSSGISTVEADVGRFREGDEWYFYSIYYDDGAGNGACSTSSGSEIWVGNDPHTPTTTGTTDLSSTSNVDRYDIENADTNIGVTNTTVTLQVENSTGSDENVDYDVYTYCDANDNGNQGSTLRTRFNIDPDFNASAADQQGVTTDDTGATEAVLDATTAGTPAAQNLDPGSHFPIDVTVELPQGVAAGDINGGTLTLQAVAQS